MAVIGAIDDICTCAFFNLIPRALSGLVVEEKALGTKLALVLVDGNSLQLIIIY